MDRFIARNRDVSLQLLEERLAHERMLLGRYERIADLVRLPDLPEDGDLLTALASFKEQEAEHVALLERALRQAGRDPGQVRPSVAFPDTSPGFLPRAFTELLGIELPSRAGWNLLARLAAEAGDIPARDAFAGRAREHNAHGLVVADILLAVTLDRFRGAAVRPRLAA